MTDQASESMGFVRRSGVRYGPFVLPCLLLFLVVFDWARPLRGGPGTIQAHHPNQIRLCVGFTVAWSDREFRAQRFYFLLPYSLRAANAVALHYSSTAGLSYYESRVLFLVFVAVYGVAFYKLLRRPRVEEGRSEGGSGEA